MKDPNRISETEIRFALLGGFIGGIAGIYVLIFSADLVGVAIRSRNIVWELLALPLALCNCIGIVGYPYIGFCLGSKYGFTVTRSRHK